jgi:acylphosphatase
MSSQKRIRRRVTVHGAVQGVFFRDSTRRRAESHGVAGWARNCPDGSVEAVFEGEAEAVEQLVEFCRRGPSRARVDRIEVAEEPPEDLSGFRVR